MPGVLGDEPCRLIVSPVLVQGGHFQFTFAILTKRRKISDHEDLFYTGIVLAALHCAFILQCAFEWEMFLCHLTDEDIKAQRR